ncbi:MAG: hypothetical protein WBD20_25530 [Pirellulaceae bacterium]
MCRIFHAVCLAILSLTPASAAIIFEDAFGLDPGSNGWIEDLDLGATAVGDITVSALGNAAIFDKTSGAGRITYSLTRTINTFDFEDITVDLSAFQSLTDFETADYLSIQYDSGSGFTDLLTDVQAWNGVQDTTGDLISIGTAIPASTGAIALPTSANNNSALQLRIIGSTNANAEDYFIDNFRVSGSFSNVSAVPEPSAIGFACVVMGGLCFRRPRPADRRDAE